MNRTTDIPSLPVSLIAVRHPETLTVIGVSGTRRHGNATVEQLDVRCGCYRVFQASRVAVEQGLVTCCPACSFEDASAGVRVRRPVACGRRAGGENATRRPISCSRRRGKT